MTQLMHQRELAVQVVLMVQKYEGMHAHTGGIRTGSLALVLVNIHPAFLKAALQHGTVIRAEDLHGSQHIFLRLVE